jgi:predicted nucleotidyltransferase
MDTENLLKSLNAHAVDYVVIGAVALPAHGYSRATTDVDIFIRPDETNAQRVLDALKDFGYDVTDLTVQDLLKYKILLRQYALETDIHPFVKGISFDEVWRNRIHDVYGGVPASFPSLDDLIRMKRAANRPKDQEDIRVLLDIQQKRKP